jgi:pimeloyl-ACP methyl ester carboxylesterase
MFNGTQTRARKRLSPTITATLGVGVALAAAALLVQYRKRKAEKENPPQGAFIEVGGVKLHYIEMGQGEPLVLFHGNGSMIQDFSLSGLVTLAASKYRVIVFDRPGFGYSGRPRSEAWTPPAQAELLHAALIKLGVSNAIVLGHSWGASVAVALALEHSNFVRALVLVSGYYYPTVRFDVVAQSVPAIPIIGDLLRYTLAPLLGRLMWPRVESKLFSPAPVSRSFKAYPVEMTLRPLSLRSSAAESMMMIPNALIFQDRYGELKMPVTIVAGSGDEIVTSQRQSERLHHDITQSKLHVLAGVGHMVHHSVASAVMMAINEAGETPITANIASIAQAPKAAA